MNVKRPVYGWVVVVTVVALLLTACGSSKSRSSSATTASPATSAASTSPSSSAGSTAPTSKPTGTPIKIFTIYQNKSGLAVDKPLPDGAIAAVQEINSTGGINGHPLEYSSCDDQGSNTIARTCAESAISAGDIAAVGTVTTEANIYLPLFAQVDLASIGAYANAAADFTSPASFPLVGGTGNSPGAVANALVREGAKKISLASIDTGNNTLVTEAAAGLKPFGLSLVAHTAMPAGPPDMAPYVKAALANGADGIEVFTLGSDVISFVRQLRADGSKALVGVVTNNYPQVFSGLGSDAVGLVDQNDYYPNNQTQIPAVAAEVKAFQAAGVTAGLTDPYCWNSYAAVMTFAAVAKTLPTVTRAAFIQALSHTSNLNIGLRPPLQFVKGNVGNLGARVFNNCVFLTVWTKTGYKGITSNWIDPANNTVCPT